MSEKDVTRNRRARRGKKDAGRQKWRQRLREFCIILLSALAYLAIYVPANYLVGCTLVGDIPEIVFWAVLMMPAVLLLLRAWFKGYMRWGLFLPYLFFGCFAGSVLFFALTTLFLGANYLVPRSEPYRYKAVVTSMRHEQPYRQMPHNYIYFLIPDNGVRFSYDSDYKKYDSLRIGDTCTVTFRNGLLGYPVIYDVELTDRKQVPRPTREMLRKLFDEYR